jgi:hypothetical protein
MAVFFKVVTRRGVTAPPRERDKATMASEIDKFRAQFDKLERGDLKNLNLAYVTKQFDAFKDCHDKCLKLEAELADTLPGARKRGINGTDVKSFSRDPIFKKKFKEYDSSVDDIDKAEKEAFVLSTRSGAAIADLENLKRAINKALPKSNEKEVQLLLKVIEKRITELEKASSLYDVRGKHKKMREYSTKFDKKVQAIIDTAPPPDKPEEIELPKELDTKELDKARKTADAMFASIKTARKNVDAINAAGGPYTHKIEQNARKFEALCTTNLEKLRKFVKHYEALIAKHIPKKPKDRNEKIVDVDEFKAELLTILKNAEAEDERVDDGLKKARARAA